MASSATQQRHQDQEGPMAPFPRLRHHRPLTAPSRGCRMSGESADNSMAARLAKKASRATYGSQIERLDRRRSVWALRAQGLSFREIGEKLSIPRQTAWEDLQKAELEWGEIATDPAVLREGLAELHAQLSGILMTQLHDQAEQGQVTTETNARGETTTVVRRWINPQIAAEASRNLVRLAGLMGLSDQSAEGNGGQNTTVVMVSQPVDGATFEARYSQAPAIDVDTTAAAPDSGRTTAAADQAAAL
jgi:hypothetical protein